MVLGARGSGQLLSQQYGLGPEVATFYKALYAGLNNEVSVDFRPVRYPAASVEDVLFVSSNAEKLAIRSALSAGTLIGAVGTTMAASGVVTYYVAHHLNPFLASIDLGAKMTVDLLTTQAALCNDQGTRFVLAGYSQGAMAIHQALLQLADAGNTKLLDRVAATVLIADGDRKTQTAANRSGTAPFETAEGVRSFFKIGERDVPNPSMTYDICNKGDIVCDFTWNTPLGGTTKGKAIHASYSNSKLVKGVGKTVADSLLSSATTVTMTSLPDGQIGTPYSASLTGTGPAPLMWSAVTAPPAGLTITPDGHLTGTPTNTGQFAFNVRVTDAASRTATATVSLKINQAFDSGTLVSWGAGSYGQLGDGAFADSAVPIPVTGLQGVTSIVGSVGFDVPFAMALTTDGTVWAWGSNDQGQLGNGGSANSAVPVRVPGFTGVTGIAAAGASAFALKSDGTVWAWGYNANGQLGNGTLANSAVPVQVSGLTGVTAIAAAALQGYALKLDGTLWAWGFGGLGNLGNGGTSNSAVPVQVSGLTGVAAISANGGGGGGTAIATKSDGTVWAWGSGEAGQFGNGGTSNSATPVQVPNLTGFTKIKIGLATAYGLGPNGTVWAWGAGDFGALGNGTSSGARSLVPTQISNLTGIVAVAAGTFSGYALASNGEVSAWGYNGQGQLGNGGTTDSAVPVKVSGPAGASAIAAAANSAYALR